MVNSSICLRFSIAAYLGGTPEYQETITTRTDAFGMVNVTIGTGNPTPGSPSFSTISWGTGPKHLKVELDLTGLCTSFITVSDQPFTSVPFALYALNSGSGGGSSTTTLTGDVSGTGTGTVATSLATTGVIAGVYGSATAVPTITVDSKGRITSATTTPIAGGSPIGSSLNNGNIIIGNNSNVATAVPVTGDVTITNTGVTAIGTGKVTDGKLDKTNIPLSGFGAAAADVALGGNKLSGVANPTLAQDAATKNYVDAKIADDITNTVTTSAPTQNAVYDALALKEDAANKSSDVTLSDISGAKFPTESAVKTYVDNQIASEVPNATTILNGKIRLAGDLAGTGTTASAPVISDNAITSAKISNGTITNDDINSAAAIQTTKIKGFYTGNYKTNVSSTTNGVEIKLSDLSIPPLNSNSTIIIHSNTTNLSIKSSVPVDDDSDVTNFELINVSFQPIGSNTIISLSYIIIIN